MGLLNVSLFGCVEVIHDQGSPDVKLTHSTQALLAYLIIYRHRSHPREILTELFWGEKDPDRSRHSLNTAIWRLRNVLEPSGVTRGTYLVSDHADQIGFNPNSPFWLDVQAFDDATSHITSSTPTDFEDDLPGLEKAVALYRGDLLEGFYDEWALRERETLRTRYLSALMYLMETYRERGHYEKSLSFGRRILEMDPLREDIHRHMIRMYLDSGDRAQAVRQYQICQEALARELKVAPMEETQELYQIVLSQKTGRLLQSQNDIPELSIALNKLHLAQATFEKASDELNRSIQTVEKLLAVRK
jgi:DNA-binding SARP family transcriptional activator